MLGDIFKAATDAFGLSEDYKARKQADKQFKSQQRESIQWRVKDAKKAGIHPLFALGASVGASPTTHVGSQAGAAASALGESVKNIGKSAAARKAADQAIAESNARIQESEAAARRDTAEAMYTDAQRATLGQKLMAQGRDLGEAETFPYKQTGSPPTLGQIEYIKPEIPLNQPADPSTSAGRSPGWKEIYDGGGYTYYVPNDQVVQMDMLNEILGGWQMLENRFKRLKNKATNTLRVQDPRTGKWISVRRKKRKIPDPLKHSPWRKM